MAFVDSNSVLIFTDGACTGNPGPGGWGSIVALPDGTVRELGGGDKATTNNRMEMTAAIRALAVIETPAPNSIVLYTDSQYLIKGITQWIWGWRSRGWKNAEGKDVANRELWEELARQITRLKPTNVDWRYVRGHAGFPGNERCDVIAVAFSHKRSIELYDGPREQYPVDLTALPTPEPLTEAKKTDAGSSRGYNGSGSSGKSGGPASYLSYHGGVVMRHSTWADCERRVKGQSNAKFKKTKSEQEEDEVLSAWGLDPRTNIVES
jgi:ribonuclease HI